MLTYTFSTREKVMLGLLGTALIVVLWYQFVFSNIQNQIASVDTQIAETQTQVQAYQDRRASFEKMKATVEEYKKKGEKPTIMPSYDNTQSLMAYLNSVLSNTSVYKIDFNNPSYSEDDGTVHRGGNIGYEVGAYEEARSIAESIARGPYPCEINALNIQNKDKAVSAVIEVTFFEKAPEGLKMDEGDKSSGGQDLSVLINRDK